MSAQSDFVVSHFCRILLDGEKREHIFIIGQYFLFVAITYIRYLIIEQKYKNIKYISEMYMIRINQPLLRPGNRTGTFVPP